MDKIRCEWVNNGTELDIAYHDTEWGVPEHNDTVLFEFLVLEGMQAGLSWKTILKKRQSMKEAFDDYDLEKIKKYDQNKINQLLQNPGIIRNRLKVNSVIVNAFAFEEVQKEFGSFNNYLWGFVDNKPVINQRKAMKDIPASTELSDRISKDLKKRGFKFVGTTIIYAYLQATGVVNDHEVSCFCHFNK